MCQVDDGDLFMRKDAPRVRKTESRDECVKCSSADVVIPHGGHAALCRACFLGNVNHKFRATVAKSQALRQGEHVLLAYSGGVASGAMLALVAEGVREGTTKKLRFRPGAIIHIDETSLMTTNDSLEENVVRRKELVESLRRHCLSIFGGDASAETTSTDSSNTNRCPPLYVAPLENAMSIGEEVAKDASDANAIAGVHLVNINGSSGVENYADLIRNDATRDNKIRLEAFLKNLKTTTSKIRAAQLLRRKLIGRVARSMEYAHVMEGVSASRVAIDIMTDLALGRGTQIPKDVGLLDDRFHASEGVTIVRPLREFSNKEIVVFNGLSKVPSVVPENLETGTSPLSSIQRATEHFILGLQTDFSSTVSTVCKTGEKLAGNQLKKIDTAKNDSIERCCLCNTVLDVVETPLNDAELLRQITSPSLKANDIKGGSYATAARALDVTTVISRASSGAEVERTNDESSSAPSVHETISRALCYSCRLISRECENSDKQNDTHASVKDLSNLKHLPSFVVQEALRKESQNVLRNQIKDFLLDDT